MLLGFKLREIKFRAYDKNEKKMFEVDTWGGKPTIIEFGSTDSSGKRFWNGDGYEIDGPLMQYTGLKDKNGKEIYEADIVDSYGHIFWVGFFDGRFVFKDKYPSAVGIGNNCEIIGNIYENPELIKS